MADRGSRGPIKFVTKWSYGVGHVLNDLCASMWFSYLLIYFRNVVVFDNIDSGIFLLVGQIADGLATPIVGIESDKTSAAKYGKRKIWHLGGTIAVALSFPFIFNLCIYGCADNPRWTLFFYYIPFIVIFQFGWASTQISHLALIPDLASNTGEKVVLNAIRYGFTIFANIFVYAVFWVLFEVNSTPGSLGREDAPKFRNLVLIVVPVGIVFSVIFHLGVKEKNIEAKREEMLTTMSCQKLKKTTWTSWFREVQFWQIGVIYMMTRLVVNISQVYIPLYVTDSLFLDKKTIAVIPLVIYVSGIAATAVTKPLSSFFGLKQPVISADIVSSLLCYFGILSPVGTTYLVGIVMVVSACCWLWFLGDLPSGVRQEMYGAAVLLGLGCTTLLITSLAMTAELVGDNTSTGAFIYGAMSFLDKLANGIAVMLIQKFHPSCSSTPGLQGRCMICAHYYRTVMTFVPGGAAVMALIVLITLSRSKIGSKKQKKRKEKSKEVCPSVNYGSIESCSRTQRNVIGMPDCNCMQSPCICDSVTYVPDVAYQPPLGESFKERELEVCAANCKCKICLENNKSDLAEPLESDRLI